MAVHTICLEIKEWSYIKISESLKAEMSALATDNFTTYLLQHNITQHTHTIAFLAIHP